MAKSRKKSVQVEPIVTTEQKPREVRAQEDVFPMVDDGHFISASGNKYKPQPRTAETMAAYDSARKTEQENRAATVEKLRQQMISKGIDMGPNAHMPGVSRINPETQLRIGAGEKPFMTVHTPKKSTFKKLLGKISDVVKPIFSGSHMDVAGGKRPKPTPKPVKGKPYSIEMPMNLKKK